MIVGVITNQNNALTQFVEYGSRTYALIDEVNNVRIACFMPPDIFGFGKKYFEGIDHVVVNHWPGIRCERDEQRKQESEILFHDLKILLVRNIQIKLTS
jgi:hypothetical protein